MYDFTTKGTCSTRIRFDIRDRKVCDVSFENGCNGNLKAVSALVEGMDGAELIKKLKGIQCKDRGTSCADQLARAVEGRLESL
ncbi:MAG: TIGR03905 family TSCPD domain-containing protein [Treponema sp.]|nr:TIGR03905 family TSCPD domain-containing protein [Treponema sp.]